MADNTLGSAVPAKPDVRRSGYVPPGGAVPSAAAPSGAAPPGAVPTAAVPSGAPGRAARNTALGAYGERVAERHLVEAGLVVLDRNWRCAAGELDLVAREGDVLVACEVKTRAATGFEHPCEAISRDKAERLRLLAERWIAAHPHLARPGCDVRVDMIAVVAARRGAARVEHVRGAC